MECKLDMTLPKKKECSKCDPLNYQDDELVDKGGFLIYIEGNRLVYDYSGSYEGNAGSVVVNFCPACGRKLNEEE